MVVALKEYCKLLIKSQEAYDEVKNDLDMYWRNLIGSYYVAQREEKYYKNTINRLYKFILPLKQELDSIASKAKEFSSENTSQKQ